jgi:hypothetical protein
MAEETKTKDEKPTVKEQQQEEQTFTQADLDRIVKERLAQQAKNKFGDYDELKAKADGAVTAEERLAKLEQELAATRADSLKSKVAARFGISTEPGSKGEPSDADLFLTGTDEDALVAQAQRLAGREADRKKSGNVAPKEGDDEDHRLRRQRDARVRVRAVRGSRLTAKENTMASSRHLGNHSPEEHRRWHVQEGPAGFRNRGPVADAEPQQFGEVTLHDPDRPAACGARR